jgi:hypothetical protein
MDGLLIVTESILSVNIIVKVNVSNSDEEKEGHHQLNEEKEGRRLN